MNDRKKKKNNKEQEEFTNKLPSLTEQKYATTATKEQTKRFKQWRWK